MDIGALLTTAGNLMLTGMVGDFIDGEGRVQLDGALWRAKTKDHQQLKQGDHVTIVNVKV